MQQGQASAPHPRRVIAALVLVQVLFGVNYVVSKVVVDHFPPMVWAWVRASVASACLIGVALVARRPHPGGGARFFGPLVAFSLLGIILNQGLFLIGLRHTTSTHSAVINTLIPVFTLLIVTLRGQESLTLRRAAGFGCALAGVLALRRLEEISFSDATWLGDLLTVGNSLSYACFLAFSKSFLERNDRLWTTAWLFLYGALGFGLMSAGQWRDFAWPEMTPTLLGCMAFAIVGGTLLTYFLNIWALAHARSSSVALFIYAQPMIASLVAWAWLGQEPTFRTAAASLLIFVGMLLGLEAAVPTPASCSARAQVPLPDK